MSNLGDSYITNPDKYFAYTSPSATPPRTFYILKSDLERLKEDEIPKLSDYSTGIGASYYKDTNGRYGGTACAEHFMRAKEIQEYLLEDDEFINRAIKTDRTWFIPKVAQDIFIF